MSAAAEKEFWGQYATPQWQRRRLTKMESAGWMCEGCGAEDQPLQVHHKAYFKGRKVWEYDDAELEALCKPCHAQHDRLRERLKIVLSVLDASTLATILGFANALTVRDVASNPRFEVRGFDESLGVSIALPQYDIEKIIEASSDGFLDLRDL